MSFSIVQYSVDGGAFNTGTGGGGGGGRLPWAMNNNGIITLVLNFTVRSSSTSTGLYGYGPTQGCSGQSRNWFTGDALQSSMHSIRTQVLQKVRLIVHPRRTGSQGIVKRRRRIWVLWNDAWKQWRCQRLLCVTMTRSRVNANRACH